jgi:hypothetical protein
MKESGGKMSLNFLDLKAKHQPKEYPLRIYAADFEKFSKLVEFINKDKSSEDMIAPEDIFEELMKATNQVEGFEEFMASGKPSKRGRKRTLAEQ